MHFRESLWQWGRVVNLKNLRDLKQNDLNLLSKVVGQERILSPGSLFKGVEDVGDGLRTLEAVLGRGTC